MNWVDYVILGVIVASAGLSLLRGFVKEAISLAGWVAAYFVSRTFYLSLSAVLTDTIDNELARQVISIGILFIATLFAVGVVNMFVSKLLASVGFSGFDRVLGVAFGALRGALLCTIVVFGLIALTPIEEERWWQSSALIPKLESLSVWCFDLISFTPPEELQDLAVDLRTE